MSVFELIQFDNMFFKVKRNGGFDTLANLSEFFSADCLAYVEDKRFLLNVIDRDEITCVIIPEELRDLDEIKSIEKGMAVSQKPRTSFNLFHNWLCHNSNEYLNHYEDTVIGDRCHIHPTAVIDTKGVRIGNECVIKEYTTIESGVTIGNNVTIGPGSRIGVPSLISIKDFDNNQVYVTQVGKLDISDYVVIGCNTVVSRGSFPCSRTIIGAHTIIGNCIEIAHNTCIGENCMLTGQIEICGNSVIQNNVRINPGSIVSNRIEIGEGSIVEIGGVVVNSLKAGSRVAGNFAIDHDKFLMWHRKKNRTNTTDNRQ